MADMRLIEVKLRGKLLGKIRLAWNSAWDDSSMPEDMVWTGKLMWATNCVKGCME